MAKIISFFKKRRVLIFLGLCALSLIVHLVGPVWPIFGSEERGFIKPFSSALWRWLAIGSIFLTWGIVELIGFMRSTIAARRLKHDVAGTEPSQAEHQVGQLESAFLKAVEALERNAKRTGKRSLTELPWYVVLGPSGVGKTELLRTSGLDFPFESSSSGKYVDGAGGTLNCKWWFTRDAILLDTAGRYMQQDQDPHADRAEWERFLALLKKHRKRQPLNGIVAIVSADDVEREYRGSKEAMHAEARRMRDRIRELDSAFAMTLPIYFVVAKCDLIAGFAEYFRDLNSDDARAQPWGFDLPSGATGSDRLLDELYSGFTELIDRLRRRTLTRLRDERSRERCVKIQTFPERIDMLRIPLCEFIGLAFGLDEFGDSYRLHGVYFTSAMQEGAPIDQLTSELSEQFGIAEIEHSSVGGDGRSYFVRDLLQDKVFPERFITGVSERWRMLSRWALRGAIAVGAIVFVISSLVWIAGFRSNQTALTSASAQLNAISSALPKETSPVDRQAILDYLDKLKSLDDDIHDRMSSARLGNYLWMSELPEMQRATSEKYTDALKHYFVPMMAARFDEELTELRANSNGLASESWFDTYLEYELVKFISALSQPGVLLDDETLKSEMLEWLNVYWEQDYADEPDLLEAFQRHTSFVGKERIERISFKTESVEAVRNSLIDRDKSNLAFELLRAEMDDVLSREIDLGAWPTREGFGKVFSWQGDGANLIIPGMYTKSGFEALIEGDILEEFIQRRRSEEWVFADEADWPSAADLRKNLERIYVEDYVTVWQNALDALDVRTVVDSADSQLVISTLVGSGSPLRKLLRTVAEQTDLIEDSASSDNGTSATVSRLGSLSRVSSKLRKLKRLQGTVDSAPQSPRQAITDYFAELNALSDGGGGQTAVDQLLRELAGILGPLTNYEADDAVFNQVTAVAATQPEPVDEWLSTLVTASSALAKAGSEEEERKERAEIRVEEETKLAGIYRTDVLPLCQNALSGRFPVDPEATQDVSLSDLARLFGDDGALDRFINGALSPFVDRSSRPWKWIEDENREALGLPLNLLSAMQAATDIKRVYFPMPYTLGLAADGEGVDPNIVRLQLWIDGVAFDYRQGPPVQKNIVWPGSESTDVRLTLNLDSGEQVRKVYAGPWALFRALHDATVTPRPDAGGLGVVFNVEGHSAEIFINPGRSLHPLENNALEGFTCPTL